MRVAYFYPWIFCKGGAERVIAELLKRTKHEFDIFTFCYDKENTFPELYQYNIKELTHIDVRGVISRGARFGINSLMRRIPDLKSYDLFNVATSGVAELTAIRNNQLPILCFCHTILRPVHEMYEYYKTERFSGWKKLPFMLSAKTYRLLESIAWKNIDFTICNSENTKSRILNAGLAEESELDVINPGVDTEKFRTGKYEHYFLVPGRIQWYKRFELAIDAFKIIQKKAKGFKMKIVGGVSDKDIPVLEFLKNRAQGLKNVEFIVSPSDEKLIELYANSYAVLFTAKDEDWGIIPVEAMASGKSVISVDEGGPRESVISGKTGFLVQANAEKLAEKMLYLVENQKLVRKMGKHARAHAKKYDWKNFVSRYDGRINRLVGSQ